MHLPRCNERCEGDNHWLDPLALTQENLDWAFERIGVLTERCEHLAAAIDPENIALRNSMALSDRWNEVDGRKWAGATRSEMIDVVLGALLDTLMREDPDDRG